MGPLLNGALAVAALVHFATTASARVITIVDDRGGDVRSYYIRSAEITAAGNSIRFIGTCKSACTILLKHVECVSPDAEFWFHAPRFKGELYDPWFVYNPLPTAVQQWIKGRGGLTAKWLILKGDDMTAILPVCGRQVP